MALNTGHYFSALSVTYGIKICCRVCYKSKLLASTSYAMNLKVEPRVSDFKNFLNVSSGKAEILSILFTYGFWHKAGVK